MTTASSLSLAQDIIYGKKDVEEDQAETDATELETDSVAGRQRVRRAPSAFANAFVDHFPQGDGVESRPAEEPVAR